MLKPGLSAIRMVFSLFVFFSLSSSAAETPPFNLSSLGSTNGIPLFRWQPYPATVSYEVFTSLSPEGPFVPATNVVGIGYDFSPSDSGEMTFYRVKATSMPLAQLLDTTLLNRLAYGPTPDELARVRSIGPDAYIEEQLAPELIQESLDILPEGTETNWVYATATGTASSSTLYVYLGGAGAFFIDDIKLVEGSVPEVGTNLLVNGDFETDLTNSWQVPPNLILSSLSPTAHSGTNGLSLVATEGGSTANNALLQVISPALRSSRAYTLSYWYLPTSNSSALTIRLSGSGIVSTPDSAPNVALARLYQRLLSGTATLPELRSWYVQHAIRSKKQLLEVLTQFLENHFVTQYTKSHDYFDGFYSGNAIPNTLATQAEFKEITRWREALANPACTFYDLLKISVESPAMIIYLDTVNSRGSGSRIANENFARELLELFTFGVDNGYDQNDITTLSKCWTGWSVGLMDPTNSHNPFAPTLRDQNPGVAYSNLIGDWSFIYKQQNHNTSSKVIFPGAKVPARFGEPWAGRAYELNLPSRNGTNGIEDGYQVVSHFADQPFTSEYISVKLCRLFVHDDFDHGYDFTSSDLSDEGKLVRECMLTWENSTPKGQMRPLLRTIFNSQLFRSHAGSMQKVKTPLEFTVSAIRALRSENADGTATADSDGFAIVGNSPSSSSASLNRISAGTLSERLRFVQSFLIAPGQTGKSEGGANNVSDPVALLKKKLAPGTWADAGAVTDYFVDLLYPAEGKANLELYRASAIDFLNSDNGGVQTSASLFQNLVPNGTAQQIAEYDLRVRGMISMLMTFQRFQEQ